MRVNGENGISDDDAAKVPKEAFKKLPKKTRAKALAKFDGAFEYVTRLKRTLFLLEVLVEGAFSRISEDDAVKIKKEEFEQFDKALRMLLLESYRRVCGFSNLERTLTLLRLDGESSVEKMVEGNAAEIPKEEFEKLDKKLRAKLLKKFRGAFEFVDSLERTLFVLRVDGESAVEEMINGDATEIPKKEFEKLDEKTRAKLLEKFRGAFEFIGSLERTLFVLSVDSEAAVKYLNEDDVAKIQQEVFTKFKDKV